MGVIHVYYIHMYFTKVYGLQSHYIIRSLSIYNYDCLKYDGIIHIYIARQITVRMCTKKPGHAKNFVVTKCYKVNDFQ